MEGWFDIASVFTNIRSFLPFKIFRFCASKPSFAVQKKMHVTNIERRSHVMCFAKIINDNHAVFSS